MTFRTNYNMHAHFQVDPLTGEVSIWLFDGDPAHQGTNVAQPIDLTFESWPDATLPKPTLRIGRQAFRQLVEDARSSPTEAHLKDTQAVRDRAIGALIEAVLGSSKPTASITKPDLSHLAGGRPT